MLDIAFALAIDAGNAMLPRDHRRQLAGALQRRLPWLGHAVGAGVHRLNVPAGGDGAALLSRRTRLTLRVPRACTEEVESLAGTRLDLGAQALHLGAPQRRELLPHTTLYAHLVAAEEADELDFLRRIEAELVALGVPCRMICGRRQSVEAGALEGYGLMLDGLAAAAAQRVLESGLGAHRALGCGIFVPHRSAAAVGTPA